LLKGRSTPGKILLTRRLDPLDESSSQERSPEYIRSFSENEAGSSDRKAKAVGVRIVTFILSHYFSFYKHMMCRSYIIENLISGTFTLNVGRSAEHRQVKQ
jgi:uncharacterized membrane protein YbaN (DUF454 family)